MKGLLYLFVSMGFLGLGFWAYHENYATQAAQREVRQLNRDIGAAHARINMLNAEWAYLNRPDRLRDLVNLNFQRLALVPLMPEAFANIASVPMAPEEYDPILDPLLMSQGHAYPDGVEPL